MSSGTQERSERSLDTVTVRRSVGQTDPDLVRGVRGTSRCWFFTWNNYPENAIDYLRGLFESGFVTGCVVGRERGASGTPHLQGVVSFKRPIRLSGLRSRFGSDGFENVCNWGITRSRRHAVEYCKKEGDFEEFGRVVGAQGDRTDLSKALESFAEHRCLDTFKDEYPEIYVKYPRGISTLYGPPARTEKPNVIWLFGPTGTGKTRWVWDKEQDPWTSMNDLKWFDGYVGQEAALFDDFRGSHIRFTSLLRLLDRYPLRVPIKGGTVQWCPKRIYVTSQHHPKDVYEKSDEDVKQLTRRIDKIYYTGEAHQAYSGSYDDVSQLDSNNTS